MRERLMILRRLLFSRIGCVNRVKGECWFLMDGTRGGRKCCYSQCQKVQERLTNPSKGV